MNGTLADRFAQAAHEISGGVQPPPLSVLVHRSHRRRARRLGTLLVLVGLVAAGTLKVVAATDSSRTVLGPAVGPAAAGGSFEMRRVLQAEAATPSGTSGVLAPYTPQAYADLGCARPAVTVRGNAGTPGPIVACSADGREKYVLGDLAVAGYDIASARAAHDPAGSGWAVIVTFTPDGTSALLALTAGSAGQRIAVVVDGVVPYAPSVPAAFTDTTLRIPTADQRTAQELAQALTQARTASRASSCMFRSCLGPTPPAFGFTVLLDGQSLPSGHRAAPVRLGQHIRVQITLSVPPGSAVIVTRLVIGEAGNSYGSGPTGLTGIDTTLLDSHAHLTAGSYRYSADFTAKRPGLRNLVAAVFYQARSTTRPSSAEMINIGSLSVQ